MSVTFKKPQEGSETDVCDQVFANHASPLEAATSYHDHGFTPVPLKHKSKQPKVKWKDFKFKPDTAAEFFGNGEGVALKLGPEFGGLVDVDLDCAEARQLAHYFLDKSQCVFGRLSAHESHWMYRTETPLKTTKFQVNLGGKSCMLLEVRGGNHLTMFPPSFHPSGEVVLFETGKSGLPKQINTENLLRTASLLAVAACMVRIWPNSSGVRQEIAMALAGGMIRASYETDYVKKLIRLVAKTAGDEEAAKRAEVVHDTATKIKGGKLIVGWPKLAELLGSDGIEVITKCKKWLGIAEAKNASLGQGEPAKAKLKVTAADKIKPKTVEWFWPGIIPRGAITIIDGDPGNGKSTVTLDLAARQSTGDDLPDGSPCNPGNVFILSAEDDAATTIVPRLKAADADISRVHIVHDEMEVANGDCRALSLLYDIKQLRERLLNFKAKLLIIDPLVAFLGGKVNPNSDHHIRTVFGPIRALAEQLGVTVIVVRHLNKKEGLAAIYRGGGSIGMIGAARSGLLVGTPSDDPETRILAVLKSNLAVKHIAWRFRIVSNHSGPEEAEDWEAGAVEWIGETDITASQLVSAPKAQKMSALDGAAEFIKGLLSKDGMPPAELKKLAKEAGHSEKTVNRAAKKIGVDKKQVHKDGKISGWMWSLPNTENDNDQDEK